MPSSVLPSSWGSPLSCQRAYLDSRGDGGLGRIKSLRAVGDFSRLSNGLKTMMAFPCPVLDPAVGDENPDGPSSCSELQPTIQQSQWILPLGWGSLPRLGRISLVTAAVLLGSPVPAGDAAPAARGGWRTRKSCVHGKQSILLMLLSLPLPSLGINAWGSWGRGDRALDAFTSSGGQLGNLGWGTRPCERAPRCSCLPQTAAGASARGGEQGGWVHHAPHHPRGSGALLGQRGRSSPGTPGISSPASLPSPQPGPPPGGDSAPSARGKR